MENWIDNHLMPACLLACHFFFCILSLLYSDMQHKTYYYDNYYTHQHHSYIHVGNNNNNAFKLQNKTEKTENRELLLLSTIILFTRVYVRVMHL